MRSAIKLTVVIALGGGLVSSQAAAQSRPMSAEQKARWGMMSRTSAANLSRLYNAGSNQHDALTRKLVLSHAERKAVNKVNAALAVKNYKGAAEAIGKAAAIAERPDAKFYVAVLQMQLGDDTENMSLHSDGVQAALATGVASREQMIELYRRQGVLGLRLKNTKIAEIALEKLMELAPQDAESHMLMALAKNQAGELAMALSLFDRAISLRRDARQPVPAKWIAAKNILKSKVGG